MFDYASAGESVMEQLNLIDFAEYVSDEWCSDDWETPDPVARYMASLVKPTDNRILEPAAGTGQIVKYLPESRWINLIANEINPSRFTQGLKNAPDAYWMCSDFPMWLNPDSQYLIEDGFDLIITNPPFSKAIEFIEHSLQLLDCNNPEARLIYLLPCDFFQSQGRAKQFAELDCRIYQRHSIVGRVAYLKNGVPFDQRQIYDCVYEIRPGKVGDALPEVFVSLQSITPPSLGRGLNS